MLSTNGKGKMSEESETKVGNKKKRYSCVFCERTFDTRQALGGHQRGHKRERNVIKLVKPRRPRTNLTFTNIDLLFNSSNFNINNNNSSLNPNIINEIKEGHRPKSEFEFVLLPRGSQHVIRTEIDFGLVSKGGANSHNYDLWSGSSSNSEEK